MSDNSNMLMKFYKSVESLVDRASTFDRIPSGKQAALKAHLSRLEKEVKEPELLALLDDPEQFQNLLATVREIVGHSETKSYARQTVDDIVKEYRDSYRGYSKDQRSGFKSRVTRRMNELKSAGNNPSDLAKLETLKDEIAQTAIDMKRDRIFALASKLTVVNSDDSE